MKYKWNIVHECDDDNGNPTCWAAEINSDRYGKFVWISLLNDNTYDIDSSYSEHVKTCSSLASAKRWVTMNIR